MLDKKVTCFRNGSNDRTGVVPYSTVREALHADDSLHLEAMVEFISPPKAKEIQSANSSGEIRTGLTTQAEKCRNEFINSMSAMFQEPNGDCPYSDFTIIVGEVKFPVHKCVLAQRSPFFRRMFSGEWKETQDNSLTIAGGFCANDVKMMLSHIYTGTVADCGLETAASVLQLAELYQLPELRLQMEHYLAQDIGLVVSFYQMVDMAEHFNSKVIRRVSDFHSRRCLSIISGVRGVLVKKLALCAQRGRVGGAEAD